MSEQKERRICILGSGGVLSPLNPAILHGAAIVSLLDACRPSAVIGRVRAVVVDTINAVFLGGLRSHVGNEGREIMDPFIAHGDAASAPVRIAWMRLLVAASLGLAPSVVFWAVATARLVAVFSGSFGGALVLVTATAMGLAVSQMLRGDLLDGSAIALAQPHRIALLGAEGEYRPSRKLLAGQVNDSWVTVVHVR